jgi:hypothetical protein
MFLVPTTQDINNIFKRYLENLNILQREMTLNHFGSKSMTDIDEPNNSEVESININTHTNETYINNVIKKFEDTMKAQMQSLTNTLTSEIQKISKAQMEIQTKTALFEKQIETLNKRINSFRVL